LPAAVTVSFGLATARNDAIASITNRLLWQLVGDNNVKLQATDGTNTLAATAVGQTLTTTMRRFQLDLGSGILTRSAPNLSLGGKANVLARMDNGRGDLRNVLPNSPINLSALTSNVQPFFQVQKTSGTAVATFSIERVLIARRI
jgi:hypothetical protein